MDRILLEGMSFHGRHGVRPAERAQPQEFKVTVDVDCDLSEPGRTDRIEDTLDYRRIRTIAKEVIEGESQKLLETLAARIAAGLHACVDCGDDGLYARGADPVARRASCP